VFPAITVNQEKGTHIIAFIKGAFISAFAVAVPLPVSLSKNAVAHAQLISVPLPVALVTVIALVVVWLAELITNLPAELNIQVSNQLVIALIPVWIILAIPLIDVAVEKSNQVIFLAVQSIVIVKLQSVTAIHVANTVVGASHEVK
jgi:hypothetical protein